MSSQQPPPNPDGAASPPNAGNAPPPPPPPSGFGTPPSDYGPPPPAPKRPVWRIVLGTLLVVLSALALLGQIASLANGRTTTSGDPAESVGYVIGGLLFLVLPLTIGLILLLKSPKHPSR